MDATAGTCRRLAEVAASPGYSCNTSGAVTQERRLVKLAATTISAAPIIFGSTGAHVLLGPKARRSAGVMRPGRRRDLRNRRHASTLFGAPAERGCCERGTRRHARCAGRRTTSMRSEGAGIRRSADAACGVMARLLAEARHVRCPGCAAVCWTKRADETTTPATAPPQRLKSRAGRTLLRRACRPRASSMCRPACTTSTRGEDVAIGGSGCGTLAT